MTRHPQGQVDLDNVPRFLDRLKSIDREAFALVSRLLNEKWRVKSCWGPEQMDVWELTLAKQTWRAVVGIERGYAGTVEAWQESEDGERGETLRWHSGRVFGDLLNQRLIGQP